jgi:hypothetical protein
MRFLTAIFAVAFLMVSGSAYAGWNIKQNDDGSTVWADDNGNTVPVGNGGVVVAVTNFAEAQTQYVVSHKDGKVTKVYVTGRGVDSGTTTVGLQYSSGTGVFEELTTDTVAYSFTADGNSNSLVVTDNLVSVTSGSVIGISINGGATCAGGCEGNVVVVIE